MQSALGNLIPNPLHPAIVHMPMALAVLVPLFVVGTMWAIRRGVRPLRAWAVTVAMMAALSLSAWASLATGKSQDEKVESVVGEAPLGAHEESAEFFLTLSVVVLAVSVVGLRGDKFGTVARALGAAGSAALLVAGINVGHTGGQLVYTHNAASAYTAENAKNGTAVDIAPAKATARSSTP
jgi:hypothetical protein